MSALGVQCETIGAFATARTGGLSDEDLRFIAKKIEEGVGLQNISRMVGRPIETVGQCRPGALVEENIRLREALEARRADDQQDLPASDALDLSDPNTLRQWKAAFKLSPGPLRVLAKLTASPGRVVNPERLMSACRTTHPDLTIVGTYVCHIRKALARHGLPKDSIENVWGAGYRLMPAAAKAILSVVSE